MLHRILLSILFLFPALPLFAQDDENGAARQKIQALKVSFFTERIRLTPDQAARFWPVYNEYDEAKRAARRDAKQKCRNANPNMDHEAAMNCVDANMDYQQKTLNLRKTYKDRLLQIISAQQLVALYQAEQDFKKMILEVLQGRR